MSPYAVVYVGPPSYRCSKRLNARSYNVQLNGTGDEENIESALVSKAFLGKRVFQILPLPKFGTTSGDKRRKDEVDPYFGPPLSIIPLDRNGDLEKPPFQIGTAGLVGCAVVTVVSKRGVYMTGVLNNIAGRQPRQGMGPTLSPELFNAPDDDTRVYIIHPRQEEGGYTSPEYTWKLQDLKSLLHQDLLPGAPAATLFRIPLPTCHTDDAPYPYDPNTHGAGSKGWRFLYEDHYFDNTNPSLGAGSAIGIPDLP
ncbi:hypothetical protein BDV29DRAFT_195486 [Aspergillus leporis]|uniref:Uncharacterized protein n=1 Tax=Aspergillus leporis TaxID=41062 RepID=A0A5N5WK83_9EURO|nr:hypothetical protein BDV29DRAFT_195486 [Aspergillus leporis]